MTNGTAVVTFAGIPGYAYDVQRNTVDVSNPTYWTTQWTTNAPSAGVFIYVDAPAPPIGILPVNAALNPVETKRQLMKFQTLATLLVLGAGWAARGGLSYTEGPYTSGFLNSGNIPDGNPAGWSDNRNVTDIPANLTISEVTVTFTISGGFNGDLYGYLSHDGVLIPLLNRVGQGTGSPSDLTYYTGYSDSGFNGVTLTDGASVNIHNYGGGVVPNGPYAPDSSGATFAGTFGGLNPDGTWTLFFADLSSGGGQSELTSWSLGITSAVPEPVNVALGVFAGLFLLGGLARTRPVRNRLQRWRAAFVVWVNAV